MKWFIRHWYNVGGVLAIPVLLWAWLGDLSVIELILVLNVAVILLHQLEEYRFPGGEPWIINEVFQAKGGPVDRYPLNQFNAAFINVLAWPFYLAPAFFPDLVWLGLAPVLFGAPGQLVVHGIINNRQLKTFYNPGLGAVVIGHLPLAIWYLVEVHQQHLIHWWDWVLAVFYLAFFMGVIMRLIGYGALSSRDSKHSFAREEIDRWDRERRLRHAGVVPGELSTEDGR